MNEEKIVKQAMDLLSPEPVFESYDGSYPNLCSGSLIISVGGERIEFPRHCLKSGGSVHFDTAWNKHVSKGEWSIEEWPQEFSEEMKEKIIRIVNENIRQGCCGGCV